MLKRPLISVSLAGGAGVAEGGRGWKSRHVDWCPALVYPSVYPSFVVLQILITMSPQLAQRKALCLFLFIAAVYRRHGVELKLRDISSQKLAYQLWYAKTIFPVDKMLSYLFLFCTHLQWWYTVSFAAELKHNNFFSHGTHCVIEVRFMRKQQSI